MTDLTRHLTALLAQTGRRYAALEQAIPTLPVDAQRDMIRLLRDQQAEQDSIKRKARMGMMPF